jgi:hypothetical protein
MVDIARTSQKLEIQVRVEDTVLIQLNHFEVKGLFGLFNHRISLRTKERITILHAPNGFGKTAILKMIAGLFGGSLLVFRQYEFEFARFHFTDGTSITVQQSIVETEDKRRKSERRYELIFEEDGNEVDADFSRILNTPATSPNVVLTDFHDFEVVLLNSRALERLLTEDGSRAKISKLKKPVFETLVEACIPLGCLRLYSHQTGSNLKFKGLNYRHFGRKLQIDIDEAIKEVFDHSNLHKGHEEAKAFVQNMPSTIDGKQLVCGHDVIAALGVALQSLIGSRKAVHCAVLELESKLRLGFSLRDFSATRTYADIKAWEERNPPFCCVA